MEDAIANALEMDANVVLGLAPESFAGILSVSGTDPHVVEYLVRGMALESYYLEQAGKQQAAQLRFDQACALAAAYGIDAPEVGEIPVMDDFDEMLEADNITGEEVPPAYGKGRRPHRKKGREGCGRLIRGNKESC